MLVWFEKKKGWGRVFCKLCGNNTGQCGLIEKGGGVSLRFVEDFCVAI